jgi:RimJ/RimL family protein N-acetyltransferase/ribosomal protein S18 acetylase RimI-like enzyme
MSEALDTLLHLMQQEVRDGILYKCSCAEWGMSDLTPQEMWEMFDVRWAALSEARLGQGLETFLMRDEADNMPSSIQIAALDPAGHAIGGTRIHIAPLQLLGGFDAVQISRVGVSWVARGAGIGTQLVGKALRIARALGVVKELSLVFLLSRILDTTKPNRVLKLYERIGFRRTNLYTVTKGLSNCLMLAGVKEPALQHLRRQGFQVEEGRERGAIYPTLLIASSVARQIQTAALQETEDVEEGASERLADLVLRGRWVTVRRFAHADLPTLHHWQHANQRPVYATMSQTFAPTMAELGSDFGQELAAADRQRFAIETAEERLIGYLLYYDLRDDIRSTYLELMVGDPDFGDGVWGQEAVRLLLEHLFDELGVHRVNVIVSQLQGKVRYDLDKLGFRHDGVLRHNEIVDGRYVDHLVLSMLEDEYKQQQTHASV